MSRDICANLAWLLPAPADFAKRCRSLASHGGEFGSRLEALAAYALDTDQLLRLGRAIEKGRREGLSFAPLTPFRLGILSNSTVDFMVPALAASAARHGIALECVTAGYNQIIQEALGADSVINRAKPDAVLINFDFHGIPALPEAGDERLAQAVVAEVQNNLELVRSGIHQNCQALCILQTLAPPPERMFGSIEPAISGTLANVLDEVNSRIVASLRGSEDVLLDVAGLASMVGLAEWHSPVQWNLAKLPFDYAALPLFAEYASRTIGALRGKSRRCLILDLDNTIWGGVVGDDGLDGIQLAQGDATGEAFLELQRFALNLRSRGVVLAVCSKNHEEVARQPFRKHPEMILREHHFAAFQANWEDKAANIRAISQELGLGLESMVFVDDNPAERALVRAALPQVAVPELPDDPALYTRILSAAGYFDSTRFSREDLKRAAYYQDNRRRLELRESSFDLNSYLASLKMEIYFQPFDEPGRARITQLINKSNQFNLTTRRYTEIEVAQMSKDPYLFTLQVRLSDRFGDNGMISVVICKNESEATWEIDTWLMSCRVLGRGVEIAVLDELRRHADHRGIKTLRGTYRPSGRNQMVKDHYEKLGFARVKEDPSGCSTWELVVATEPCGSTPMTVHSRGFHAVSGLQ